jgi:hypothetical protein
VDKMSEHNHPVTAGSAQEREDLTHEPARNGLLLDIGGDTGALVIYAGDDRDGSEVEVSPAGDSRCRQHNVVRARQAGRATQYAAVFPALSAGDYTVWAGPAVPAGNVTVSGGQVAQFRLPR